MSGSSQPGLGARAGAGSAGRGGQPALDHPQREPAERGAEGVGEHVVHVGAPDARHAQLVQLDRDRAAQGRQHHPAAPVEPAHHQRQQEAGRQEQQQVAADLGDREQAVRVAQDPCDHRRDRDQLGAAVARPAGQLARPLDRQQRHRQDEGDVGGGQHLER
jgi:hypothetical protein